MTERVEGSGADLSSRPSQPSTVDADRCPDTLCCLKPPLPHIIVLGPAATPMLPTLPLNTYKYYIGITVGTVGSLFFGRFWGRFRPKTPNHATHAFPGGCG